MSSLARAQCFAPGFDFTVLVLSKLDKYYADLSCNNVNAWIAGYGNLPEGLVRFAMSLPHLPDNAFQASALEQHSQDTSEEFVKQLRSKGMSEKFPTYIGFSSLEAFLKELSEVRNVCCLFAFAHNAFSHDSTLQLLTSGLDDRHE